MSVGCEGGDITFNLNLNVDKAVDELSKVNDLFTIYLALANRAGLSGPIMDALRKLQQIRIAIQLTLRSLELLQVAYLGAGPIGWAIFGASAAMAAFTAGDVMMELGSH